MKTLGPRHPRIRLLRRRAGLSQLDLAALLGHRSHSQVSRYENGRRIPPATELLEMEVIFGVVSSGVFPHLRDVASEAVLARVERLIPPSGIMKSATPSGQPSRKDIHFRRILESIKTQTAP